MHDATRAAAWAVEETSIGLHTPRSPVATRAKPWFPPRPSSHFTLGRGATKATPWAGAEDSSLSISLSAASDELGDIEIEHSGSSAGIGARGGGGGGAKPGGGGGGGGSRLHQAAVGGRAGGVRRESAVEVLNLDGPKAKKTNITRVRRRAAERDAETRQGV